MRESEMYNGEVYANAGMAIAEDLRLRYPRQASTRSQQFAAYMEHAADDWPAIVGTSFWIGCAFWVTPAIGEKRRRLL
jgi:hypothetical protein